MHDGVVDTLVFMNAQSAAAIASTFDAGSGCESAPAAVWRRRRASARSRQAIRVRDSRRHDREVAASALAYGFSFKDRPPPAAPGADRPDPRDRQRPSSLRGRSDNSRRRGLARCVPGSRRFPASRPSAGAVSADAFRTNEDFGISHASPRNAPRWLHAPSVHRLAPKYRRHHRAMESFISRHSLRIRYAERSSGRSCEGMR